MGHASKVTEQSLEEPYMDDSAVRENEAGDILLQFISGVASPQVMTIIRAQGAQSFTLGAQGDWRIAAEGVLGIHVALHFDGTAVYVARVDGEVFTGGMRVGNEWHRMDLPATVSFGGAVMHVAQREPSERSALLSKPAPPPAPFSEEDEERTQVISPQRDDYADDTVVLPANDLRTKAFEESPELAARDPLPTILDDRSLEARVRADLQQKAGVDPVWDVPTEDVSLPGTPVGDTPLRRERPAEETGPADKTRALPVDALRKAAIEMNLVGAAAAVETSRSQEGVKDAPSERSLRAMPTKITRARSAAGAKGAAKPRSFLRRSYLGMAAALFLGSAGLLAYRGSVGAPWKGSVARAAVVQAPSKTAPSASGSTVSAKAVPGSTQAKGGKTTATESKAPSSKHSQVKAEKARDEVPVAKAKRPSLSNRWKPASDGRTVERQAVDAVIGGDVREALQAYRYLSAKDPNSKAYQTAIRILERNQ